MKLWVDVYNAAGVRQGGGPIFNIHLANIKRSLDRVGSFNLMLPGTDARAQDLLVNEARLRIFVEMNGDIRQIGGGIVRKRRFVESAADWRFNVSGPDDLDELKRVSTWLGLEYDDETLTDISAGLIAEASGWSDDVEAGIASETQYVRFDGASIFKAYLSLVESKGLHLRAGDSAQTIEIGAFGTSAGITCVQVTANEYDIVDNDDIAIIEKFSLIEETEQLVNFIVPLGSGKGDAQLDLSKCTRSTGGGDPYNVQSMNVNGRTLYYIANSASISSYGQIEKVLKFSQIQVLSNSEADLELAANALYDVAAVHLTRNSQPQTTYSVTLKHVKTKIKPGDKLHIIYKGVIEVWDLIDGHSFLPPQNINDEFWVMDVTESYGPDGLTTVCTISDIDQVRRDAMEIVVGAVEEVRINNLVIDASTSHNAYVYQFEIDPSNAVLLPFYITDRTLRIRQVLLRVTTRPFRATAQNTDTEELHRHLVMRSEDATSPGTLASRKFSIFESSTGTVYHFYADADVGASPRTFDTGAATPHSHSLEYGISDDTVYPEDLQISVQGTDRTTDLGGPWGTTGSPVDEVLDITQWVAPSDVVTPGDILVNFTCDGGQGLVQVIVEVYEDIQNLA